MVSNMSCSQLFLSHPPKKYLEVHIEGVMKKASRRDKSIITEVAALFHDLGKLNPNFQLKLFNKVDEYSNHSLLSAVGLAYFAHENPEILQAWFGNEWKRIGLKQVLAIIIAHHGNLPNLSEMLNTDEATRLITFLKSQPNIPAADFLKVIFKDSFKTFNIFDAISDECFQQKFNFTDTKWRKNALNNFLETQFSFSSLIEADKRDAGQNEIYQIDLKQTIIRLNLKFSLDETFINLKAKSTLNALRTQIRTEAVANLKIELQNNNRIFSLTAPTGAGKTYTLLALAQAIQDFDNKATILYALPFLSIIEQVEDVSKIILPDITKVEEVEAWSQVLAFHSKSVNFEIESIQNELDNDANPEVLKKLVHLDFSSNTFDHPFILTTFVQFFESLMSNHNSTLLKLPNFKNRIFLIDEIQALPPRLYIFFSAWLDAFCKKFNSYCILSTATMPFFQIEAAKTYAKQLFHNYEKPIELLDAPKFFNQKPFNRYKVSWLGGDFVTITDLKISILNQTQSCLIILNTIKDTQDLYDLLKTELNCILLNTQFIPFDRRAKIEKAKQFLAQSDKIILISTQLIEAGVDVDFPVVYRDLCPLPSLIQSAGRCNRNGILEFGEVNFFRLKKENGQFSCNQIYREDETRDFLRFSREQIIGIVEEKQLFEIQKRFFEFIGTNLTIGAYPEGGIESMVECVNAAQFKDLGKFRLILEKFGEQFTYYIPNNRDDINFLKLIDLVENVKSKFGQDYKIVKAVNIELEVHQKKMADRLINIRIHSKSKDKERPHATTLEPVMGVFCLSDLNDYSSETGIAKISNPII